MKLQYRTLLAAAALAIAGGAHASAGVFESFVAIDAEGSGPNSYSWYGGQQVGPNYLTGFDALHIGDYTVGDTAYIAGAELETFKNSGSDVTGAELHWSVDGGATFNTVNIGFTSDVGFNDAAGNMFTDGGDQKWAALNSTPIDFLSGLTAGSYTLDLYLTADTSDGTQYSSNGGKNYIGSFTISDAATTVPEPSTLALAALSMLTLGALRRKR